jgi:hypothetical protein
MLFGQDGKLKLNRKRKVVALLGNQVGIDSSTIQVNRSNAHCCIHMIDPHYFFTNNDLFIK